MTAALPGAALRVLHLLANYKWTGPADPAIRCAAALRAIGIDVVFAQAAWTLPGAKHRMQQELRRARLPVIAGLELRKHFRPRAVLADAARLRRRLVHGEFDVVHCHLPGDHLIAAWAARGLRRASVVVRSLYEPEPPRRGWRERIAFGATAGVVVPTAACARATAARFALPPARVLLQEPPVAPRGAVDRGAARASLGLPEGAFAIGITARIQPHRRFDLLWATARRVVDRAPEARFVLLGRGSSKDLTRLVLEPVRRLGLTKAVVLPGYLHEPRYSQTLAALDAFVFLVPGSDGTCRAVREALACGLPVVALRRGMLPQILAPAQSGGSPCGVLCEEHPDALATALLELRAAPDRAARLGAAGLAKARGSMDPRTAAQQLAQWYGFLAGAGPS